MAGLCIVIGNKRYSSWSLRGWLVLERSGAPFEERVIPLDRPDTAAKLRATSPAARVPVLVDGDLLIWDSMAIAEYLAERFPEAALWPSEPRARARARSLAAEMHSGFTALRAELPMDLGRHGEPKPISDETRQDIARILEIWRDTRAEFGAGGDYLFGDFSIADAYFAPVATRFISYAVGLENQAADYCRTLWEDAAMRRWRQAAAEEPWVIEDHGL
jgi:glutathione S-transferase